MKILLDTHALLWWLADDPQLSAHARSLIASPSNPVLVSAVSGWEMSIKKALDKLDVDLDVLQLELEKNAFEILPVSFEHGIAAGALPLHHRDPFDRMLIAQAQSESLYLVSVDSRFADYDVDVIW